MSGRERTMLLRWRKQVDNPIPSRRSKVREIDRRCAQEAERPGIGYLLEQARVERGVSLEEPHRPPGSAERLLASYPTVVEHASTRRIRWPSVGIGTTKCTTVLDFQDRLHAGSPTAAGLPMSRSR